MLLSDSARMYEADAAAIRRGIPGVLLMERAAAHLAWAAWSRMGQRRRCIVFCGSGNNGGDGIGAAALLRKRGVQLRCFLVGSREKMSPEAREMERQLRESGGCLEDFPPEGQGLAALTERAALLIDALCGIGLHRPIEDGPAAAAVELMNRSGVPVLSADIPSGVEADSGLVRGRAVKAAATVTFSMAKPGHFIEPGCTYCGELLCRSIGIPDDILAAAAAPTEAVLRTDVSLPRREPLSHKGSYGHLLILGGSVGYTGAPNLAAAAAVRAGAGLVSLGVPESIWAVSAVKNTEAMPFPLPEREGRLSREALPLIREKLRLCDAAVIGPGLGRSEETRALVRELLAELERPALLDADALWAVGGERELLKSCRAPLLLTPHPGEFRLLGGERGQGRLRDAADFAADSGCTLLLKGHRCLCAFPDGSAAVICAGNPGMARGGSGDVLAGILGALLGQLPWEKAVKTGAWLHAAAGDLCARRLGEYGMTPSDIIAVLPELMKSIEE